MDYLIQGIMIGGFALIATPAQYGVSGVKTFIVSNDGIVYEKDLGPDSLKIAKGIELYNPDKIGAPPTTNGRLTPATDNFSACMCSAAADPRDGVPGSPSRFRGKYSSAASRKKLRGPSCFKSRHLRRRQVEFEVYEGCRGNRRTRRDHQFRSMVAEASGSSSKEP
jgi:hypothetical protein